MKQYKVPKITLISLDFRDVITASGYVGEGNTDPGDTPVVPGDDVLNYESLFGQQ